MTAAHLEAAVGAVVYVYGHQAATVLFPDDDGAIVREHDDASETWLPWADLHDERSCTERELVACAADLLGPLTDDAFIHPEYTRAVHELVRNAMGAPTDSPTADALVRAVHDARIRLTPNRSLEA